MYSMQRQKPEVEPSVDQVKFINRLLYNSLYCSLIMNKTKPFKALKTEYFFKMQLYNTNMMV